MPKLKPKIKPFIRSVFLLFLLMLLPSCYSLTAGGIYFLEQSSVSEQREKNQQVLIVANNTYKELKIKEENRRKKLYKHPKTGEMLNHQQIAKQHLRGGAYTTIYLGDFARIMKEYKADKMKEPNTIIGILFPEPAKVKIITNIPKQGVIVSLEDAKGRSSSVNFFIKGLQGIDGESISLRNILLEYTEGGFTYNKNTYYSTVYAFKPLVLYSQEYTNDRVQKVRSQNALMNRLLANYLSGSSVHGLGGSIAPLSGDGSGFSFNDYVAKFQPQDIDFW